MFALFTDLEKELEKKTQQCNEFSEKISQKTREIQKWQVCAINFTSNSLLVITMLNTSC